MSEPWRTYGFPKGKLRVGPLVKEFEVRNVHLRPGERFRVYINGMSLVAVAMKDGTRMAYVDPRIAVIQWDEERASTRGRLFTGKKGGKEDENI